MRRQMFGGIPHVGVGDHRNLLDVLLMVADEAEVGHHRAEAVPTGGEGLRIDDQAGEIAVGSISGSIALAI